MNTGDWAWCKSCQETCRIVAVESLWGQTWLRVWLTSSDTVVRVSEDQVAPLKEADHLGHAHLTYVASAAKVADAAAHDILLAPMEATVIPLPHQINALKKAVSGNRVRYLLADEVGLGKTIEAGLILRELKLRGRVKRVIVLAPKGLVTQWVAEMKTHFNEEFRLLIPGDFGAIRQMFKWDNIWAEHPQVVCPVDAVKPIEKRKGWGPDRIAWYNRDRFEDLITAGWDLVIVDEAHRLGGSTDQVARYKLGKSLSLASPCLLLLTATPHQGKTEAFHRLVSLLDERAFPDVASVTRDRVTPYVIRTEKRRAIDAKGEPLFLPRHTRLAPVAWEARHGGQRLLYEQVTEYVRRGYNQAIKEKKGYIGFLMILMQRLVSSSTRAIRATLERRLAALTVSQDELPPRQLSLFEDLEDLDAQEQLDALFSTRVRALKNEKAEVKALLEQARAAEAAGPDAKAEMLLNQIYELMQQEGDSDLRILVFTEFVPTQEMLAEFLGSRGFSVARLNGSMGLSERQEAQSAFSRNRQILVSTDAGGEGLNLQFCHVVINYDLPWNPMRIEQRIGRVDRIGQAYPVRALNFIFEDTVEFRVREVLEQKLQTILEEFGVDKTGDVLDSVQAGALFDDLYMDTLANPDAWESRIDTVVAQVRQSVSDVRESMAFFSPEEPLDPDAALRLLDHPMPFWVEKMTLGYLEANGGQYEKVRKGRGDTWRLTWPDGEVMEGVFFSMRDPLGQAGASVEGNCLSLENSRVRGLTLNLPQFVQGQPSLYVNLPGLSSDIQGFWSLWAIRLQSAQWNQQKALALFVHEDGRTLIPTANYIWDLMVSETPAVYSHLEGADAEAVFEKMRRSAEESGRALFEDLARRHQEWVGEERDRTRYSFEARKRAISRLRLPEVRTHRLTRLELEMRAAHAELEKADQIQPDLIPLIIVHVQG